MPAVPAALESWPVFQGAPSEASRAFLAKDWSETGLGPVETWDPALLTALSMVLHANQPMLIYWGPAFVQIYNDAFIPSFGQGKHPEAMGQRASECWAEVWSSLGPFVQATVGEGSSSWFENERVPVHRNGRLENVWWTFGYSPIHRASGDVGGCLVVVTEVTDRILIQRRLLALQRLSRATALAFTVKSLFEITVENLADPDTADLPFVVVRPTDGSAPIIGGLDAEQAEGVLTALEEGTDVQVEVRGHPWTEPVSATAIVPIPGVPRSPATLVLGLSPRLSYDESYRSFVEQVAEHLAAEHRRIEAHRVRVLVETERNELLLQAPIATALMMGPEHRFRLANERYVEMVGGRNVLDKSFREAFPELADAPSTRLMDEVYRTGVPLTVPEMHVPFDVDGTGEPQDRWFSFALQPIRLDGSVEGMMAIAVDITTQVAARKAVEASQEERDRLFADLEAANRAKDGFLAMLGHELRNPLSPIVTATELLRIRGIEGIEVERGIIERQARHMVRLVDDLLDISRITRGMVQLQCLTMDLDQAVERAVEQVRPLIDENGHTFQVSTEPELMISGDVGRLVQVISNLLVNASRYTESGGTLELRTLREGSAVVLQVIDDGIGIPPDRIEAQFLPFTQAGRTLTGGGLGLGLAIVRSLVEAHGGTVTLRSLGLGHGTTAEVRLPLALEVGTEPGTSEKVIEPPDATVEVLLVDDNVDAAVMLSAALEAHGYITRVAHDGPAALELARLARPDIVLLDLGLPGMDGYQVAVQLSALEGWEEVPLVALTGFGQESDRMRTAAAGFAHHLVKPVQLEAVDTTLRRLLMETSEG